MNYQPYIPTQRKLPEITFRVIVLSCILALVLALSNAYLALKIGLLTSASIPAAILSMGILRFFKNTNVLENNLVQTAASAGEAVSGGIVFTAPALILIHYWDHFPYWENLAIALIGGTLGVLFSIPLRKALVSDPKLPFPEGQAITEVLIAGSEKNVPMKDILLGGALGGLLELCQTGFKLIANSAFAWFKAGSSIVGFGAGFSATMVGAGYLMGFRVGLSLFIGALFAWLFGIPLLSHFYHVLPSSQPISDIAINLWGQKIRYMGIGAMLVAGFASLGGLIKPFASGIKEAKKALKQTHQSQEISRVEQDVPLRIMIPGLILAFCALYGLFHLSFPWETLNLSPWYHQGILFFALIYVAILGFLFSALCGYFSGLVGVTASPGSAIAIAGILLAAILLRLFVSFHGDQPNQLSSAAVITVFITTIMMGISCIANDNIQDLKVGYLLGATPWKQQLMLWIGVIIASSVIPLVMEMLFNVYGIGDVLPRPGMSMAEALPAPPAAMVAAITQGVFNYSMPWNMVFSGGVLALILLLLNKKLKKKNFELSVLGVATGMYLPIATTFPIFMGALLSYFHKRKLQSLTVSEENKSSLKRKAVLVACGLVSGAALMDVLLAIPFSLVNNPDLFRLLPEKYEGMSEIFGMIALLALVRWFYGYSTKTKDL